MSLLYRLLTFLAYLVIYPYGRIRAAQGNDVWRGRLGLSADLKPADLWIHAASVGEVKVVGIVIEHLLRRQPSLRIQVSVMTPAGFRTAESQFGDRAGVSFFPLDVSHLMKRFLLSVQPKLIMVAETEIWPNLIMAATARRVPLVLINGRMSEKSFGKYRLIRGFLTRLFKQYNRFFFRTAEDLERYRWFGVAEEKSVVAGDIKFDAPLPDRSQAKIDALRRQLGVSETDFLLVAGSTRQGEEELLMQMYLVLKKEHGRLRLLLAPRHLDRVSDVCFTLDKAGISRHIYDGANGESSSGDDSVIVVSRMGLLNDLYMAADLAFVGGTLVDIGGHNILEPVWAGAPVLFGKSLDNVVEAADYIISHNYGAGADTIDQLQMLVADVITGRRKFAVKRESDRQHSPAVMACDYILDHLSHV